MKNESPQTRTLRLIVQDNTKKNPLHERASIWIRGSGSLWRRRFHTSLSWRANIGEHKQDLCIFAGDTNQTIGVDVDYVAPPVEHPEGSTAYQLAGTIYIDFHDEEINVHGVPIGLDVVVLKREKPLVESSDEEGFAGTEIKELVLRLEKLEERIEKRLSDIDGEGRMCADE